MVSNKEDDKKNFFDVFIGYYRKTASDFAEHLWAGLNETGYRPFIDVYNIPKTINKETSEWRKYRDGSLLYSRFFY